MLLPILGAAVILWLWGKLRADIVGIAALFALAVLGIIPAPDVFSGFSHPAVITLAAMMVLGYALHHCGALDMLSRLLSALGHDPLVFVLLLSFYTVVLTSFLGYHIALVIVLPFAVQLSGKRGIHPSRVLMPLAFASILGGFTTLWASPSNIYVSFFRQDTIGKSFGVWEFFPLGLILALAGVLFITATAWLLLPGRHKKKHVEDELTIEDFITEVKVLKESLLAGSSLRKIMQNAAYEVTVIGLVRKKLLLEVIDPDEELMPEDILIIEADSENLRTFMDYTRAKLIGGRRFHKDAQGARNISMQEVVVLPDSGLVGKSAAEINLRSRYGINLLAVSRAGRKTIGRVGKSRFRTGDVLLIQGRTQILPEVISAMGCLPLQERGFQVADLRCTVASLLTFILSIVAASLGWIPTPIALSLAALLMVLFRVISPRDLYQSINWSAVVLMATLIPIAHALQSSGTALKLATMFMIWVQNLSPLLILGLVMASAMLLANLINPIVSSVLLSPIVILIAQNSTHIIDPYLMALAFGSTASFLNPKSNMPNTLVMSLGGYRIWDFWRMGLPLQILILLLGTPLLYWYYLI